MEELLLLYALRRADISEIERRFSDALDEDHLNNADMFDISRATFSQNRHHNATMRTLEKDLSRADAPLLYLLSSLCEVGMELTQELAEFRSPRDFAAAVAERYAELEKRIPSAPLLAQRLTEIKAEHAQKRLRAAISQMEQIDK